MSSAIVTGATGILGSAIVKHLGNNPQDWKSVFAVSRSKKSEYPSNVTHKSVDLTASASEIASQLKDVSAEYIFFAAYLQEGDEARLAEVNGAMLRNFLEALETIGVSSCLKRVILVTGAKQYGVHLGPAKVPMEEDFPRLEGPNWPPNFYYTEQDILAKDAKKHGYDWTVTYSNEVIGVADGNFMNLTTSLGIYCAVTRELEGPGGALDWPGGPKFFAEYFNCFTYAPLHAEFCDWAAKNPAASNQGFNVVNGEVDSYAIWWPKLAKRFGLTVRPDMLSKPAPDLSVVDLAERPPVLDQGAADMGTAHTAKRGQVVNRIDIVRWSKRQDVRAAWQALAEREGLQHDAFDKATWDFLSTVLGREYQMVISMGKARAAGWTGYIDSYTAFAKTLDELEDARVLPRSAGLRKHS